MKFAREKTYEALCLLYDACVLIQQEMSVSGDCPERDLLEWMTIRLGCPRRSGKTTAIKKLISDRCLKAAVISPSHNMAKMVDFGAPSISMEGVHQLADSGEIDVVFVDEADFVMVHEKVGEMLGVCASLAKSNREQGKPFVLVLVSSPFIKHD